MRFGRPPTPALFPYTTLFRSPLAPAGERRPPDEHRVGPPARGRLPDLPGRPRTRSEEHTSELQSHVNIVCRLLLDKNNPDLATVQDLGSTNGTRLHYDQIQER